MFEKTVNKELTSRNETEKQNTDKLKEFHVNHIDKFNF